MSMTERTSGGDSIVKSKSKSRDGVSMAIVKLFRRAVPHLQSHPTPNERATDRCEVMWCSFVVPECRVESSPEEMRMIGG